MNTLQFLQHLRGLGVRLWVEGDQLRLQAPKGVMTAELREQLASQKSAILSLLQATQQAARSEPSLQALTRSGEPLPLALAQQRLWFIQQLNPTTAAYHIPIVVELQGSLDRALLEQALNGIIARHETLRTWIEPINGLPMQQIAATIELTLRQQSLPLATDQLAINEIEPLIQHEIQQPFDLSHAPLLRALLINCRNDHAVLVLTIHHLVADGWSLGVLAQELATIYKALQAGKSSTLPPLEIQYADYAEWQQRWLAEHQTQQLDFWRQHLAGEPGLLQLPYDYPRPMVQRFHGARQPIVLDASQTNALRNLAQQAGTTLFVVLLACFNALLTRYSNQTDLWVGTAVAQRTQPQLERLIGFFVNTLVLRTDTSGAPSFRTLIERTRQVTEAALANQDVPFATLVETVAPTRSLSHNPLFQVLFVLQNTPMPTLALGDVMMRRLDIDPSTSKVDISLDLTDTADGLSGWFEYNTDLFTGATIARMAQHWLGLIEACLRSPDQSITKALLLTASEQAVLAEWEQTHTAYPSSVCVHELFTTQAQRTPTAIAVEDGARSLTYEVLERQSNQLAQLLQAYGVGAETRVGICLDRSVNEIVAILAILKAGGAYVPLEPFYPRTRLAMMVADAGIQLVLTESAYQGLFEECPAYDLAALESQLAEMPTTPPNSRCSADQLAYIMYTSGSTGQPKGVGVCHRNIVRLVCKTDYIAIKQSDRFLHLASVAFDAATFEIWAPLLNGACVVIYPSGPLDPALLAASLHNHKISVLWLTAGLFHQMVEMYAAALAQVNVILAGGDVLSPSHVQQLLAMPGARQVINGYGPTENTTFTCCHPMAATTAVVTPVPIGRPIANTQVYILNQDLQRVPVGVVGELYVAGAGLARGYWSVPDRTAERFLPNPWSQAGARMYRTGDLARYRSDGTIEFLGRIDQQVKIRGFRIELGEIEAVLRSHVDVQDCLVRVLPDPEKRLYAYVVGRTGATADSNTLWQFLQERLPEYMLPAAVIILEQFPLTPNGKVDRNALPMPSFDRLALSATFVAPRTPTEQQVAALFAEILGIEQIGVDDSFFELGGHSLMATQVIARLREHFQADLSLVTFFATPTVAALAADLDQQLHSNSDYQPIPQASITTQTPYPLSFAQERLWFLEQVGLHQAAYNMPFALEISGTLDIRALRDSLTTLAARHAVLRTRIESSDGVPHQIIVEPAPLQLDIITLTDYEPATLEHWLSEEAQRPFKLEGELLWRAILINCTPLRHVLSLTLHHSIADGWSMGVIVRELSSLYNAYHRGTTPQLADLPIQYVDFARWQHSQTYQQALSQHLEFWHDQLAASRPLQLPTDRPYPRYPSQQGGSVRFTIDAATTSRLRHLSNQAQSTLFMTLFAAFNVLLYRYTGQQDLVVGTTIANRQRKELESLIGFFVNVLVLRTRLNPDQPFDQLLRTVRNTALAGFTHQDAPFEKVVEMLHPNRELGQNPLFQVMFSLQNAPIEELTLDDVTLRLLLRTEPAAKFDLDVDIWEQGATLAGHIVYATDLFDQVTIERLALHYQMLLSHLSQNPAQAIGSMPLLSPAESSQLLELGQPLLPSGQPRCMHQLYQMQVQRHPTAWAVVYAANHITYAELDRRSNQLAHYLRRCGVRPEVCVGLHLDRSIDQAIAVLAVWKAGGAYVPLDPAYPQERLTAMLKDSDCRVIIGHAADTPDLLTSNLQFVALDRLAHELDEYPATPPSDLSQPEHLAYVLFTSGSTGRPKAVMVSHRNIYVLYEAWNTIYGLNHDQILLQLASFSFDVWVGDFVRALCNGARLVMCPREVLLEPAALYELIVREQIDYFECVPAVLRLLVEYIRQHQLAFPPLKSIVVGADIWYMGEHQMIQALAGAQVQVFNSYGITETTIDSIYFATTMAATTTPEQILLGKAFPNVEVYVLDQALQLVPIGVTGELYIGGESLARGYMGQPALTAERFIPHPFNHGHGDNDQHGRRLYRTGDRVRWRSDGVLEFLGRNDTQVKLRGLRLELGEVEMALKSHESVVDAAVVVRGDQPTEQQLVAYVVPRSAAAYSPQDLIDWLRGFLPAHAIPQRFVELPHLPLSPNGKVDRRQLPPPDAEAALDLAEQPTTAVEAQIAAICGALLGVSRIDITANLFDLGAHSLLATQIVARIRQAFDVSLPLRLFFAEPTVAGLASHVERERHEQTGSGPALTRHVRPAQIPLSFAQQRLWFLDQLEPGNPFYNIPAAVRIRGQFELNALQASLDQIIERHEALRTIFTFQDGMPWQVIPPPQPLQINLEDLSLQMPEIRQASIAALMSQEALRPFNLATGPLLRARALRVASDEHIILLTMHHIVSDGWSMNILIQEITTLYAAHLNRQEADLPTLPIQYADFALWQRAWFDDPRGSAVLEQQLNYWRRQLAGPLPTLRLPTDFPRPEVQTFQGAELSFCWPETITNALRDLGRQEQATLFMTILAAVKTLLYRYTGQEDLIVGSPIANRHRPELEGLIGFFVNMLVLRSNLAGKPTFREVLRRVREVALETYSHQDIPFEKLVEELQPERTLSRTPLFQVVCALDHAAMTSFEVAKLQIDHLRTTTNTAMFDLIIGMVDSGSVINGTILYNTDLFKQTTITSMLEHLEAILQAVVAEPNIAILDIPLSGASEPHAIQESANVLDAAEEFDF